MFLECGIWNSKLLILLFYPIGDFAGGFISKHYSRLYYFFTAYLSFLLAGPLYLIILSRSRKKSNESISIAAERGSAINKLNNN